MAKVVHFEIPARDPQESMGFFTEVFGWKFQQWAENEYYLTESGPKVQRHERHKGANHLNRLDSSTLKIIQHAQINHTYRSILYR